VLSGLARAGADRPPETGTFDIRSLAGLPTDEAIDRIVDEFCEPGILDEDVARIAIGEAVAAAQAENEAFDPKALDANALHGATLAFVAELVFILVYADSKESFKAAPSLEMAAQRESDLRSLIREVTDQVGGPLVDAASASMTKNSMSGIVARVVEAGTQKEVLQNILQLCALAGGRIISLHSRGAIEPTLDLLSANTSAGQFVLHWFVGNETQVARAAEMGCWFSVGPSMFQSKTGRAALAAMPRDRILPESDGPFTETNRRSLCPWDAWQVVIPLAEMWNTSQKVVERTLMETFRQLVHHRPANISTSVTPACT
jgi:hypothetical protein